MTYAKNQKWLCFFLSLCYCFSTVFTVLPLCLMYKWPSLEQWYPSQPTAKRVPKPTTGTANLPYWENFLLVTYCSALEFSVQGLNFQGFACFKAHGGPNIQQNHILLPPKAPANPSCYWLMEEVSNQLDWPFERKGSRYLGWRPPW